MIQLSLNSISDLNGRKHKIGRGWVSAKGGIKFYNVTLPLNTHTQRTVLLKTHEDIISWLTRTNKVSVHLIYSIYFKNKTGFAPECFKRTCIQTHAQRRMCTTAVVAINKIINSDWNL